jgi:hypothetical protein
VSKEPVLKTIRDARAWSRVTSTFGTPRRPRAGPDGYWLWEQAGWPQRIDILRPARTRLVLVCPKREPVGWWVANRTLPADVATFISSTPSDPRGLPLLESLAGNAPVVFIGDLDPPALAQFVETQRMAAGRVHVRYGGVNDAWLDHIASGLTGKWRFEHLCIPLAEDERALFAKLEDAIDVAGLVGPRGATLLRGGLKLEVEGATNPAFFRRDHGRRLIETIRSTR